MKTNTAPPPDVQKYSALSNAKMEASGIERKVPPLDTAVEMYLKARETYFSGK